MTTLTDRLGQLITDDPARWQALAHVRSLQLPDCWVGAGFVRNRVWDHLHGRDASPMPVDVDVLWYDPHRRDAAHDRLLEARLRALDPGVNWSVKNQARMHARNGDGPYRSTADAMRFWPETATGVAVRRTRDDRCEVCAPRGLEDLFALVLRPTPRYVSEKRDVYESRIASKGWLTTWPLLRRAAP